MGNENSGPRTEHNAHKGDTRLRRAISRSGFFVYEIAAMARLEPRILHRYISGREPIKMHHLMRLCEALHADPEDLVGFPDDAVAFPEIRSGTSNKRGTGKAGMAVQMEQPDLHTQG